MLLQQKTHLELLCWHKTETEKEAALNSVTEGQLGIYCCYYYRYTEILDTYMHGLGKVTLSRRDKWNEQVTTEHSSNLQG